MMLLPPSSFARCHARQRYRYDALLRQCFIVASPAWRLSLLTAPAWRVTMPLTLLMFDYATPLIFVIFTRCRDKIRRRCCRQYIIITPMPPRRHSQQLRFYVCRAFRRVMQRRHATCAALLLLRCRAVFFAAQMIRPLRRYAVAATRVLRLIIMRALIFRHCRHAAAH